MEAEEKTASGIVLPGSAQEKPQIAEVLAVGPGTQDDPMELKVGDKVIFSLTVEQKSSTAAKKWLL